MQNNVLFHASFTSGVANNAEGKQSATILSEAFAKILSSKVFYQSNLYLSKWQFPATRRPL
jgi:hypothetical protein